VLLPLIPARLHGWLDELVSLTYVAGALALSLEGAALATALAGAAVHFALTRVTDYPRGAFKLLSFRAHAFVELAEGALVLAATWTLCAAAPLPARVFLALMGLSQLVAFAFSDYRPTPGVAKLSPSEIS
jgi:hypothetical protein